MPLSIRIYRRPQRRGPEPLPVRCAAEPPPRCANRRSIWSFSAIFPRLPLLFRSAQVAQGYHCCLHAAVSAGAGGRRCSPQRVLGSGIVRPGPRAAERGRSGDAGRAAITNLNVSTFCYVTLQCNASLRYYHYRHGDYYAAAAARRITPPWGPCRSPPPPLPPPTSRQRLRQPSLCLCSPPQAPYDQSACCRAAQS
jgi:hypothetical protein